MNSSMLSDRGHLQFGWTPCVGPVLSSVLAITLLEDGALQGAPDVIIIEAALLSLLWPWLAGFYSL